MQYEWSFIIKRNLLAMIQGIKREEGRRNEFEIVLDTGSRHVRPLPCTIIHITWCDSLVHESRN